MKLMAFTDVHGDMNIVEKLVQRGKKDDIDFCVCAGDFTVFEKQMKAVLKKFDTIGKPIILIPGNHEDPILLEKNLEGLKNIVNIHKSIHREKGITFLGWGTDGFTKRSDEFRDVARNWRRELNSDDKKIILITHAPPYKTQLDALHTDHVGNLDIRKAIERIQPVYAISGHIHETEGEQGRIGKTIIVNPGWKGMILPI